MASHVATGDMEIQSYLRVYGHLDCSCRAGIAPEKRTINTHDQYAVSICQDDVTLGYVPSYFAPTFSEVNLPQ